MPAVELLRTIGRVADPLSSKEEHCFPGGEKGQVFDVNPAMAERLVTSRPENPAAKYVPAKKQAPAEVQTEPDAEALAQAVTEATEAHAASVTAVEEAEAATPKTKKSELKKLRGARDRAANKLEKAVAAAEG